MSSGNLPLYLHYSTKIGFNAGENVVDVYTYKYYSESSSSSKFFQEHKCNDGDYDLTVLKLLTTKGCQKSEKILKSNLNNFLWNGKTIRDNHILESKISEIKTKYGNGQKENKLYVDFYGKKQTKRKRKKKNKQNVKNNDSVKKLVVNKEANTNHFNGPVIAPNGSVGGGTTENKDSTTLIDYNNNPTNSDKNDNLNQEADIEKERDFKEENKTTKGFQANFFKKEVMTARSIPFFYKLKGEEKSELVFIKKGDTLDDVLEYLGLQDNGNNYYMTNQDKIYIGKFECLFTLDFAVKKVYLKTEILTGKKRTRTGKDDGFPKEEKEDTKKKKTSRVFGFVKKLFSKKK